MSEIFNPLVPRSCRRTASRPSDDWQTLRLAVHRGRTGPLSVALIETRWSGAAALDRRTAALSLPWDPDLCVGHVDLYALRAALQGVARTRL